MALAGRCTNHDSTPFSFTPAFPYCETPRYSEKISFYPPTFVPFDIASTAAAKQHCDMVHLRYSDPSFVENEKAKKPSRDVVILGGGVIGLLTAYYLALSLQKSARLTPSGPGDQRPHITIIDSSDRLYAAASSQATGSLGYSEEKESKTGRAGLACLSYRQHVRLAEQYNGKDEYGWSDQVSTSPILQLLSTVLCSPLLDCLCASQESFLQRPQPRRQFQLRKPACSGTNI